MSTNQTRYNMNHQEQKQEEKEGKQEEQQSFFFVPIQPIQPAQAALPVSFPASFPPVESLFPSSSSAVPPLTDAYLRKRTVHQVAHGVPYSEQKRSKFAQP